MIVIQWVGFTVLLGAIPAGIVTAVSRRKSRRKHWQRDLQTMADALCQKPEGDAVIGLADAAGLSRRQARKAIEMLVGMRLAPPPGATVSHRRLHMGFGGSQTQAGDHRRCEQTTGDCETQLHVVLDSLTNEQSAKSRNCQFGHKMPMQLSGFAADYPTVIPPSTVRACPTT